MVKGLLCKVNGSSEGIREEVIVFCFWFGWMNVGLSQGSDCVVDGDSGGGLRGGPAGPPKAGKPAKGARQTSGGQAAGKLRFEIFSVDGGDEWRQVAISLETRGSLKRQPRGVQLEYRVKAINKSGESPPSNTVAVVL